MKFNTAEEVRSFLWDKLNLNDHAITFHVVDAGDDILYFRPGIIMCRDDFEDSDALSDIGTAHYCSQPVALAKPYSKATAAFKALAMEFIQCCPSEKAGEAPC